MCLKAMWDVVLTDDAVQSTKPCCVCGRDASTTKTGSAKANSLQTCVLCQRVSHVHYDSKLTDNIGFGAVFTGQGQQADKNMVLPGGAPDEFHADLLCAFCKHWPGAHAVGWLDWFVVSIDVLAPCVEKTPQLI